MSTERFRDVFRTLMVAIRSKLGFKAYNSASSLGSRCEFQHISSAIRFSAIEERICCALYRERREPGWSSRASHVTHQPSHPQKFNQRPNFSQSYISQSDEKDRCNARPPTGMQRRLTKARPNTPIGSQPPTTRPNPHLDGNPVRLRYLGRIQGDPRNGG